MMSKPSTALIKQVLTDFDISLPKNIKFTEQHGHLTNDSRMIGDGDIFCAIIGQAQDGRHYINTAIEHGASLIIRECEQPTEHGNVSVIDAAEQQVAVVSFYQLNNKLFKLASAYYQAPQTRMTMIGITGTNGKTSTSQLLGQILTQCQSRCAIIGTNGAGIIDNQSNNTLIELANTTPSATDLVQFFNEFADQRASHLAMEVSSHALEQERVSADIFDIAVFTNLSRDHLDYHGTMADYASSKRQLFTHSDKQIAILNGDDEYAKAWLKHWSTPKKLWLYGRSESVKEHAQFVSCHSIKHHSAGVDFVLNTHLGDIDIQSPLLGDFNIDNLLAVISVLLIENITLRCIAEQIKQLKAIAGRMESFSANSPLHKTTTAVVDYAHTPDALEKALIACRQHCHGNLYVVFGCGGDRDKGKRGLMAKAAEKYADCLVVTSDNPRTEAPMSIINDVVAGLSDKAEPTVIENREQAVLSTLAKATFNDVVLLAGKGHEDYIILGKDKIDYNERQVVMDFFKRIQANQPTMPAGEQA
jgi:UDP-N-acetylmuramoyl-L-alanyl-D-glutamate--2,6-diaminopimelate ligase